MLNEMRCIHFWRLTPRQWGQETVEARARMLTYMLFKNTCDAYRDQWKEDNREKKGGKSGSRDESSFAAMRERLRG
jgi:hypothetical protein